MSLADRVWQGLRTAADDLRLGDAVGLGRGVPALPAARPGRLARPGAARRPGRAPARRGRDRLPPTCPAGRAAPLDDAALVRSLASLAAEKGPSRRSSSSASATSRRTRASLSVTRAEHRRADGRGLVAPDGAAPCSTPPAASAPCCSPPTGASGGPADRPGDRRDRRPDHRGTAAAARPPAAASSRATRCAPTGSPANAPTRSICDPPFNERAWGYEELIGDPRWEYGLPPRGESELAWVQHCLAHVRPGGHWSPSSCRGAAAGRRAGKRIRANLLRAGALRVVATVQPGGPDLWLLRRPDVGERPPSQHADR